METCATFKDENHPHATKRTIISNPPDALPLATYQVPSESTVLMSTGTVVVTFCLTESGPSSALPRKTVLKCHPAQSPSIIEDGSRYAHPLIAKLIAARDVLGKVMDPTVTVFSCSASSLDFDKDMARGLEFDFACWLTESGNRVNAPLADNMIAVTLTAEVVLPGGGLHRVSLPPLRLSFRKPVEIDTRANEDESQGTACSEPSSSLDNPITPPDMSSAPFPVVMGKPSGRLPHFYQVTAQNGASYSIPDLRAQQLWPLAESLFGQAMDSTNTDMVFGLAAASSAEMLMTFGTAPIAIRVKALHYIMQLASHYVEVAPDLPDDDKRQDTEDGTDHLEPRRRKFNDWYIACCLCIGVWYGIESTHSIIPRERLLDEYFPVGFDMAARHYKLCAYMFRHIGVGFEDRPAFSPEDTIFRLISAITLYADYCTLRYHGKNNVDDLDETVRLYREALRLPSLGPFYEQYLSEQLAAALALRFDAVQDETDVDEMLEASRECIAYLPESRASAKPYVTLARALKTRGQAHSSLEDVTEAVENSRIAARIAPDDSDVQLRLADTLLLQSSVAKDPHAIDEAILIGESLLNTTNEEHREYSTHVSFVASCLYQRFRLVGVPQDAREALSLLDKALQLDTGDHIHADCLHAKAMLLHLPKAPMHDAAVSLACLKEAMSMEAVSPSRRVQYMNDWLVVPTLYSSLDAQAANLYIEVVIQAVRLLPLIADLKLEASSRLRALKDVPNFTTGAVILAITARNPDLALELAEEGRSIFWTQALRLRSQIDDVPEDLRKAFLECTRQLEETKPATSRFFGGRGEYDDDNVRRRRCARDLAAVAQKIRLLPGFDRFLLPQTPEILKTAGDRGPVVILTAAADDCMALVIRSGCVFSIRFGIKRKQLEQLQAQWQTLAEHTRRGRRDDQELLPEEGTPESLLLDDLCLSDQEPPSVEDLNRAVKIRKSTNNKSYLSILKTLWHLVVNVVMDVLNAKHPFEPVDKRLRIWWCPTGPFNFLPLHAAGVYQPGGGCCSDYCVSSYTPTLQALLNARATLQPLYKKETKILLGAAPHPFEGNTIPVTTQEIHEIAEVLSAEQILSLPHEDDVLHNAAGGITTQTALERLSQASIFHLASHGQQVSDRPLESGFLLRDAKLTISDVMRQPLPNAFLAFLSACETAKGADTHPEESVHLASAMLFAGFKSVIATMWSMDDVDGPEVAKTFYRVLFGGSEDCLDPEVVPYALDDAVRALREKGVSPGRWATYVHIGI